MNTHLTCKITWGDSCDVTAFNRLEFCFHSIFILNCTFDFNWPPPNWGSISRDCMLRISFFLFAWSPPLTGGLHATIGFAFSTLHLCGTRPMLKSLCL
jgi:hypothetical protein